MACIPFLDVVEVDAPRVTGQGGWERCDKSRCERWGDGELQVEIRGGYWERSEVGSVERTEDELCDGQGSIERCLVRHPVKSATYQDVAWGG